MDELRILGREAGPRGEVVLRRRGRGDEAVDELIVNGVFAMDSLDPASERALAQLPVALPGARVLLGGLGLGYTAAELLASDAAHLVVVELEPALVGWARGAVTPVLGRVAADPRVELVVGDVADVLSDPVAGPWDAVLLDVDNGPDFLIHAANAALYAPPALQQAYARLAPRGVLAIWCQGPHAGLRARLTELGPTTENLHHSRRGRREWSYVIYTLQHP